MSRRRNVLIYALAIGSLMTTTAAIALDNSADTDPLCNTPRGIGEREQCGVSWGYAGLAQDCGGTRGERHVTRFQRLAVGADCYDGIGRRCRQHLGIAGGGKVRSPCGVGGAGLKIGGEITRPGRGGSRQDETECEEYRLTCWDNWGLRRPRVRPS